MGKRLQTVEEHTTDIVITTATVDIQVIRIGTKQMTLAVFRQLPRKDIFDLSGNLLADPWGWVNYDREGRPKPFLFSLEGILYRWDVNVEQYETDLKVIARKELIEGHYNTESPHQWIPPAYELSGYWGICGKQYAPDLVDLAFLSEDGAAAHLENRLVSAAVLKAAPQLFIGV
jgi:hypothetical protein